MKNRSVVLIFFCNLLLIAACIYQNSILTISGNVDVLYPRNSPSLESLRLLQNNFEDNFFDVITINKDYLEKYYFEVDNFQSRLNDLEGVEKVISPLLTDEAGYSYGFLVKPADQESARFLLAIQKKLSEPERLALDQSINSLILEYSELSLNRHGSFFITESLTQAVNSEILRLVPLSILILIILLFILFKNIKNALLILLPAFLALVSTLGFSALLSTPLNPISQLAPSFILVVGVAYSIHVFISLINNTKTPREVVFAIMLASGTTTLGLLSLILLDVKGVSLFAVTAGVGNLLSAIYALILLPAFVNQRNTSYRQINFISFMLKYQKPFLFLLVLMTFGFIGGINQIRIDTNPVSFLPKNGSSYRQIEQAEKEFKGNRFISLIISKNRQDRWGDREIIQLEEITKLLNEDPNVLSLVSPIDALTQEQKLSAYSISEQSKSLAALISRDRLYIRYIVETDLFGKKLIDKVNYLNRKLEIIRPELKYQFTAFELIMAEQAQHIIRGIINSLAYTFLLLSLILLVISRSLYVTLIALIPNVIPIIVVYGIVGYLYKEISLGAAIVSCAVLGIAVDNTFHILTKWQIRQDTQQLLKELAPAFILTMLTLAIGFSGMLLAEVLPTFQFALLLISTLVIGFIADVTILPYFLDRFPKAKNSNQA